MALNSFVSPSLECYPLQQNSFSRRAAEQAAAIRVGGANRSRTLARWGK